MKKLITYRSNSLVTIGSNTCGGSIRFMLDSKGGSYYATDDEAKQKAIEGCYLFAEGRIKVVKVEEISEKGDSDYSDNSGYRVEIMHELYTNYARIYEWVNNFCGCLLQEETNVYECSQRKI